MTQPQFRHLDVAVESDVLILTITEKKVQGEQMAGELREEMLAALGQNPSRKVLVDFQQTEYISSVAFWPLLSVYRRLQEHGGKLMVCGLSKTVGDIFFTTRLVSSSGSSAAPFGMETDRVRAIARLVGQNSPGSSPATA
jgi:anti-anti-sigma factor